MRSPEGVMMGCSITRDTRFARARGNTDVSVKPIAYKNTATNHRLRTLDHVCNFLERCASRRQAHRQLGASHADHDMRNARSARGPKPLLQVRAISEGRRVQVSRGLQCCLEAI